jgi:hypothetical protein
VTATFKLKFFICDNDIGLSMTWMEEDSTVVVPPAFWPRDEDEMKSVAMALFPVYKMRVDSFHRRVRVNAAERERYYKKLVPEQEEFEIQSQSGKTYKITVMDRGRGRNFHCSCPDYAFRRRKAGTYCKHIAEWLKKKEHPVADEIAVQDEGPSMRPISSLMRKLSKTLRTGDIDEFLEEEFEKKVRQELKCRQELLSSGSMMNGRRRTRHGRGSIVRHQLLQPSTD